ncbi:TonB-dependent receptor domain-containing protein [Nostoc sp.]|uniref:TonB-dependent receptor domain-containing protein n=1 Tax=Nostoc sp. TaxID=1180 RepID=UPI002FF4714E
MTGKQDGYSVPDASTATRTDTPLRDIPQSIQVVPQQVLKDQQAIRASEALRNVSGVQRSIAGQILPGWNVIASYAYTDAKITQSNDGQQGNQLFNVPFNAASLWTTYELQTGNWKGLGFGLGLFYVGDRQGDLANDFKVSSYLRTDASIFYRRNSWKLGLNFNNLFNVNYIDVGQSRTSITPGAPFAVVGSFSVEF